MTIATATTEAVICHTAFQSVCVCWIHAEVKSVASASVCPVCVNVQKIRPQTSFQTLAGE